MTKKVEAAVMVEARPRKTFVCMRCSHQEDFYRCTELQTRLAQLKPNSGGYVNVWVEYRCRCIEGQEAWTEPEKRFALRELKGKWGDG